MIQTRPDLASQQHDIYLRYRFLHDIIEQVFVSQETGPLRILDIGCGATRLTEAFLGALATVVRADVDDFGDPDIVVLKREAPLPFDDAAFDLVIAIEVLEHVPRDRRSALLAECRRVARNGVVVCCPVADGGAMDAEAAFSAVLGEIAGKDNDFLREHRAFGLPSVAEVTDALSAGSWQSESIPNAPIDQWLLFNLVDLVYAYDFGAGAKKNTYNTTLNSSAQPMLRNSRHYRQFFLATPNPAVLRRVRDFIDHVHAAAPELKEDDAWLRFARFLPQIRQDLLTAGQQSQQPVIVALRNELLAQGVALSELRERTESERADAQSEAEQARAHAAAQDTEIARLEQALAHANDAVAVKSAEVARLDQEVATLSAARDSLATFSAWVRRNPLFMVIWVTNRLWDRQFLGLARAVYVRLPWRTRIGRLRAGIQHRLVAAAMWGFARARSSRRARALVMALRHSGPGRRAWMFMRRNPNVRRIVERFWSDARANPVEAYAPVTTSVFKLGATSGVSSLDLEKAWYLAQNPDVAATGVAALQHYRQTGMAEGRSWGLPPDDELAQQAQWYLQRYPDVAASGTDPLRHFLQWGLKDGRAWPGAPPAADEIAADTLPWVRLLNLAVDPALALLPALNVLLPGLAMRSMSGGPNTAVNLACRLAASGIRVRLVSVNAPPDADPAAFWEHATKLSGIDPRHHGVELVNAWYRGRPFRIGENDLFMATAWWTAQAARYAVRHTRQKRFLYLIQDYESLLHPASTQQALAEESYGFDYLPVINTHLLHDFLVENKIGRFAEPDFAAEAVVFEPAVDTALFFPVTQQRAAGTRKRLLFYARPTNGLRNLFELAVAALRKLVSDGVITPDQWEICGMGDAFDPIPLGGGNWLTPLAWKDLPTYAQQMRESAVLLSPMLSPHPSYPPLEMAACGRPVVTTVYGNKNAESLAALSPNIIGTPATIDGLAAGLVRAISLATHPPEPPPRISLPATWSESFAAAIPQLHTALLALLGAPLLPQHARLCGPGEAGRLFPGYRQFPGNHYNALRFALLRQRDADYRRPEPGMLSLLTTVWNTDPVLVTELAETVFGQDCGAGFEWIILDNGTTRRDTRRLLDRLADHPAVTLMRVEQNKGIIGGMRLCLEAAHNRYVVPLDSDDLLTPDCLRIVTSALQQAGCPPLAYTDEDKLQDGLFRDPYCKPDWDPVLFVHSCYIAHICAIDRELALQLGAYSNPEVNGSHDWDTFMRFHVAGHTPHHVPELVYTWRMHPQSTSGNMNSKDYIFPSQRSVVEYFASHLPNPQRYRVALSPLFDGTPDWRIIRDAEPPPVIPTVTLGSWSLEALRGTVDRLAGEHRYIHLLGADAQITGPDWAAEAMTLFEAFPDTVVVGGRIVRNGTVVAADTYRAFGRGWESPNIGRTLADPGYFAQMWKPHSADAVPVEHCVVDAGFLADTLRRLANSGAEVTSLGQWLGVVARAQGRRIVYSPFLSASVTVAPKPISAAEQTALTIAGRRLTSGPHLLSPRLGMTRATAYQPVARQITTTRPPATAMSYPEQHAAELMARRAVDTIPAWPCRFSLLTTLYSGAPAGPLQETVASVLGQTLTDFEWIVLEKGQVSQEVKQVLSSLRRDPRVRLFSTEDLGIIDGLRFCLERATGTFVVPVDGDDLLTIDALQQLSCAISGSDEASFVYSDEDSLSSAGLAAPYRRSGFDPVLNAVDSYVWHLCAFRLDRALALGVYTDNRAEFCHDWDTISRFAQAGEAIVHVPEVLYHWRTHEQSSSNSGTVNRGSLDSVRHILHSTIARQANPELYEVGLYPISRGVDQFTILRRPVGPAVLALVQVVAPGTNGQAARDKMASFGVLQQRLAIPAGDLTSFRTCLDGVASPYVVLLGPHLRLPNDAGLWEAVRLFEMHANVGAVGGRILDQDGIIIDCCVPSADAAGPGWIGMRRTAAGPYAMALKPQIAATVPADFFVCRTDVLKSAVANSDLQPLKARLAETCRKRRMIMAYAPVLEAIRCEVRPAASP